ncbi:hypothetical protein H0E84_15525 [Luteimonas sp. SJ-92]|uniref:Uncharacterized protein n=1 Tax=Luteimonas salinisoli TaxID=2752307 RepID=A0A853JHA5_9GAMM|nr:hypothetical protein [Luteimonas salinisoli]NZA27788.1 hypothetical protein [Luteimonas salinisoli]
MNTDSGSIGAAPVMTSRDIVAGLGAAPRDLLAACLALFDDSTLQRRIGFPMGRLSPSKINIVADPTDAEAAASIRSTTQAWLTSPLSDDALRVLLWMYLREAFALLPVTFTSCRSAATAADDMVARALHSLQPSRVTKYAQEWGLKSAKEVPATLDALARKTMEELMAPFFNANDAKSVQARERLLSEVRARVGLLPPEDRERLMHAVEADGVNDAALRKILLTGGGLGALGASVSLAGFSAYILAAQASAFIPLVSGPALVSVVAVLSNPITIIAATASVGWWATRSANQKVRGAVGVRVLSLLALNGLEAGAAGIRAMLAAFPSLEKLGQTGGLAPAVLGGYRTDWNRIAAAGRKATVIDDSVVNVMERPTGVGSGSDRLRELIGEQRDTVLLAGLTLGDIAYNAYSLDPLVLEAADFSRIDVLDDPVAFAAFAHRIESMDASAHLGAVSNLKGYVAERVVAARLIEQGHVVEFPAASNEAGWDVAVDGVRFQVKDVGSLAGLQQHFDSGYDYPVIANAEVADELAARSADDLPEWADQIHFVEGYSNEVVEHVTRSSFEAGGDMLHPDVPLFTLVLSGIRNLERVNRDEITGTQAFQEVLLDGGARAGLAVAGNYVGVGVGLLLFGPAGALVLGAVMPILSQRQSGRLKGKLDELLQDETYRKWAQEAEQATAALAGCADDAIRAKAELLRDRQPADSQAVVARYLQWRLEDELTFLREARLRLKAMCDDETAAVEVSATRLMSWLTTSTLHPSLYQAELSAMSEVFAHRPSTADRVTEVSHKAAERTALAAGKAGKVVGDWWRGLGNNNKRKD